MTSPTLLRYIHGTGDECLAARVIGWVGESDPWNPQMKLDGHTDEKPNIVTVTRDWREANKPSVGGYYAEIDGKAVFVGAEAFELLYRRA